VSGALDVPGTGLPVEAALASVRAALDERGTAVLVAPPGSGKTTVVPLHLVGQPWANGRIVVLEPRRIAARAAARRMAELLGEPLGQTVGYRTRDERKVSGATQVEVITEGILVRRLQRDPSLPGIAAVLLDEVHERNLVTDLSLALSLDVRRSLRPDLRLLAMSATIDADRLAGVLGDAPGPAPVVRSDAERHELTVLHRPAAPRERLDAHVARVVGEVLAAAPVGDVLVFLPGAADIRRVAARLTTAAGLPAAVDVLPLHGSLPSAAQDAALAPSGPGRRRVVLATDIAESSLTVAGVRIVVDAGSARVPVIDGATGLSVLRTEPASTASVEQRAGRAARLGPGVSVRLWDDAQVRRPAAPTPEVLLADLTGLALELAVWGAEVDDLPFPDPPPAARLAQGRAVLAAIGAIDVAGRPTATGRRIAELPLHPRLGALVLAGVDQGVGATACALAALLAERDVVRGGVDAPVDLAARVELVVDGTSSALGPELVDRRALDAVRRTARRLARTVGVDATAVAPDRCGSLLAVAFPERLAQAQGDGRFRLRGGGGGAMPTGDALARSPYLVVADLEGGRIRRAAAIDDAPLRATVAGDVMSVEELVWDVERDDLRVRRQERSGALVLAAAEGRPTPGPATVAALLERVRATDGSVLRWTAAARAIQGRAAFAHRLAPEAWPDVSDVALLAELDTWLGSHLLAATGRVDLERLDLVMLLWHRIGHHRRHDLDRLAPTSFEAVDGRAIPIAYDGDRPRSSVRAQQLFGLAHHPTVGDGQVPVVLELLSPAGRPVQVTADLPGFGAGTWAEVRKDLAGRYPKHPWPADPSSSSPPSRRPRRPGR
jgi:ATP-dependent helicase HrpB